MGSVRLGRLVLLEGCKVLKIGLLLLVLVMRLKMRRERVAELITCDMGHGSITLLLAQYTLVVTLVAHGLLCLHLILLRFVQLHLPS